MSLAIGIDLGTTNSCVALYRRGKIEIIKTTDERTTTPSFVYFDNNGSIVVGKDAVKRSAIKPENGIFDAKRFIGRKFNDPVVQEEIKKLPFTMTKSTTSDGFVAEVTQNGRKRQVRPEEVSAEVLKKLRNDVRRHVGCDVTNAVITVPAYFTINQKGATRAAARLAGFNVLKLINEPTAAALTFNNTLQASRMKRTVLVYDLGGGTFDVSLVEFQNGEGTVMCTHGDSHLGGRDFDNALMDYFMDKIKNMLRLRGAIVSKGDQTYRVELRRMKLKCEAIKKKLSTVRKASLSIEHIYGIDVDLTVTRQQFEDMNKELFKRTIDIMQKVLNGAGIGKELVDDVVLVGGSTKIPKIQQMVQEFFSGKFLNRSVNPDEAVAIGAAIQAAISNDCPLQDSNIRSLVDVTSLSMGVATATQRGKTIRYGEFSQIINRTTKLPAKSTRRYSTFEDWQTALKIDVYEGESTEVKYNYFLGTFTITGLPSLPKYMAKADVTMEIDESGLLKVTAEDIFNKGNTKKLNIKLDDDRLTDREIEEMIQRFGNI